jgi:hypothetical protein
VLVSVSEQLHIIRENSKDREREKGVKNFCGGEKKHPFFGLTGEELK